MNLHIYAVLFTIDLLIKKDEIEISIVELELFFLLKIFSLSNHSLLKSHLLS